MITRESGISYPQRCQKSLKNPYIGHRSQYERYKQHRIQNDWCTKENRLIDCKADRNDRGLADGPELLGFRNESAHGSKHERCASTANGCYEITGRMRENSGRMLSGLECRKVGFDIGNVDCRDGRLNNGRPMDTNKPEHRHGTINDRNADVTIRGHKERLKELKNPGGEKHAGQIMEGNAEHPEYKHRYRERNEVGKSLRDIMRDLLRKLNGDIAAHKELVDIRNGKGYYECGEQTLRAHVVRSQPALHLINRNEQEADDRDDHDRNRVDLPQFRQLVVDIVREALGDGRYHEHREDTHGIAVGLPQRFTDVVRPFVINSTFPAQISK